MSATVTDRQDFRRIDGPAETTVAGDNAIFELTSTYQGDPTPSGGVPYYEVTYYVEHFEAPANLGDRCPPGGVWAVQEMGHWFVDFEGNDDPVDEGYSYEGGSHLWYWTKESAIAECGLFAAEDESWKMNDWTPE